jgi:hypothetical protein
MSTTLDDISSGTKDPLPINLSKVSKKANKSTRDQEIHIQKMKQILKSFYRVDMEIIK